jgi:hypothetical protein
MGAAKSLLSYNHYIPDTSTGIKSSIEAPTDPTDTDEASIPTEPERTTNDPNKSISGTTLKRKVCTETCVTKLSAQHIKSSPDEDIPARKKPRLQVSLPAIVAADADTESHRRWTPEEDTNLTTAVKTTCKKKYGEEYRPDWVAISKLVPGRTKNQCWQRWHNVFESKSDETIVRVGKRWTKEEDDKLKDAIEKHNGKNWAAISALVPGRTKTQCKNRWHSALDSKSDETIARVGKWTTDEDSTLKDAVEKHNGKNWAAISALVPGRTKKQCLHRWHSVLDSNSDETIARLGKKWTNEEDGRLKDAVEKHNGKNWAAISELVPGRTKHSCKNRWLREDSKSDETTARVGNSDDHRSTVSSLL